MRKTILNYTAKGAQVSLEQAMRDFDNSISNLRKERAFGEIYKIYEDLFSLKKLGVPLTARVMSELKIEYDKRKDQYDRMHGGRKR